jgi:hypothetical protein
MNMITDRQWWPFAVDANAEQQSTEMTVKLNFLAEAARCGGRAFVQNNELECGAIGDNGRECLIVWRGKHRAEAILLQSGELKLKRAFSSVVEGEAFNDASAVGVRWLDGRDCHVESEQ